MITKSVIFDFAGTLVKMRPATLLIKKTVLKDLSTRYRLALVTGARRTETINILRKLDIENLFADRIMTKDDTSLRKPDPELLADAIRIFRLDNPVYTGDKKKDKMMATKSNIKFVLPKEVKYKL